MKIGFIGLGNVGSKLAGSLLRNGFDLSVFDLNSQLLEKFASKGAEIGEDPANLMHLCDLVITCLPSPAASNSVMQLMLPFVKEGKTWLEMSTTDDAEVRRLGAEVISRGGKAVDCPVSGGCHRANTGNISIFAGCDRATFEIILPLLTTMGRRVLHTGELGSASILKVITNFLATANLVSCAEALTVAKAAGLDLRNSYEAIRISSGNSFVHETESQVILNGSYNINFTMDLVLKDTGLFDELAKKLNAPLEISPKIVEIFKDGQKKYGSRAWSSMIVKRMEDLNNINFRANGFPDELIDNEPEEKGYEI